MSQHRQPPTESRRPVGGTSIAGALHSPAALARLLTVTLVGLGLDLFTKVWAFKTLMYERITLPDGSVVGIERDTAVELTSGVDEGDQVVLPTGASVNALASLTD